MLVNTRSCLPLTAPLLALTLAALSGCDSDPVGEQLDVDSEIDAPAEFALADDPPTFADALALAGNPRTFAEELAAATAPPSPREPVPPDHHVCGVATGPAAVELDISWSEARDRARLHVALARPDDVEVSVSVAVVVDGETVAERPGAINLGGEALADAHFVAERSARPWRIELGLGLDDLDLDADAGAQGMLVLVARVHRSDGTVDVADRPLYLYFERGEGGVRFFDEVAGAARDLARRRDAASARSEVGGEPARPGGGPGVLAAPAADPQHGDILIGSWAKFCIRHSVTYVDSGLAGEDYWTAGTAARAMTGADARVYAGGQKIWEGHLGDGTSSDPNGEGCTPSLFVAAGSAVSAFYDTDTGEINGNYLRTRTKAGSASSTMVTYGTISAGGTYYQTGTNTSSVYPVYLAIAKAMRAHSGGAGGITYNALTLHDDGSRYDSGTQEIRILSGDESEKFLVVHEYGHAFGDQVGDGYLVGGDCSKTSSDSDCSSGGSHGMTSIEWQSCAVNEGFAHFVAADTFNNHAQDDCAFRYWSNNHGNRNVDCEADNSHILAWMENMCQNDTKTGAGVELDWLRQFWDVHTNGGTTNMIPFMAWIRSSGGWTKSTAYSKLNTAAQNYGGDIKSNWNVAKAANGVDY